ncbi:MAG: hypothetical protein KJO40_06335 [Deltaproteobacteria bacterium]|nr:hypothetical protein [Deltaproteobacteria bacterium]NND28839.1 hypothetical protein [Myxococcales bacterium]MBT8463495.1 hypothetical protein [Deltaproteobacteria bacterium]MBT8482641.1 hypothetical protein [Deltaproteobacteria bacterium]NNK06768.1 hypothetical protein [Myxococcales bacterium]
MAKHKALPLRRVIAEPRRFVARLLLADLIAKRGEGPLERKRLIYGRRKR